MAVDQATKDYIFTHFEEYTAKELAEKFKISKSTVTHGSLKQRATMQQR